MARRKDKQPPIYVRFEPHFAASPNPFDGALTYVHQTGAMMDNAGSNPNVRTPVELVRAITRRYGKISVDLAATAGDEVEGCDVYLTPEINSLAQDWGVIARMYPGHLFCNPPYSKIAPWVAHAARYAPQLADGQFLFMLIPASVGANYWRDFVDGCAFEQQIGRVCFDGYKAGSMKDHCLLIYSNDLSREDGNLSRYWDWKALLEPAELAAYNARSKGNK